MIVEGKSTILTDGQYPMQLSPSSSTPSQNLTSTKPVQLAKASFNRLTL
nr:MAG TPA: hypothetical protein [Caudoviricetes sp.]